MVIVEIKQKSRRLTGINFTNFCLPPIQATFLPNKFQSAQLIWKEVLFKGVDRQKVIIIAHLAKHILNQRINGPVAHLRLFILSKFMVTILNNKTYGYGSRYSLKKPLVSVSYNNLVWNLTLINLAKQKLHINMAVIKWHTKYQKSMPSNFTQEDFQSFSLYVCLCKMWPPGQGHFWSQGYNLTNR